MQVPVVGNPARTFYPSIILGETICLDLGLPGHVVNRKVDHGELFPFVCVQSCLFFYIRDRYSIQFDESPVDPEDLISRWRRPVGC
jgi:hypothetical protein